MTDFMQIKSELDINYPIPSSGITLQTPLKICFRKFSLLKKIDTFE